jgi:hypothetical protein
VKIMRVDGSPSSAVYVCGVCGCRDVFTTRPVALRAAAAHLELHGEHTAASVLRTRAQAATRRPTHRKSGITTYL